LRRYGSSQVTGAALILVGLVIGSGLVFLTTYLNGGPPTRTISEISTVSQTVTSTQVISEKSTPVAAITMTQTVTTTSTVTATITTNPFTNSAQVQASVTTCTYTVPTYESCVLQVLNSGSANTATAGCSITLGGVTYTGTTTTTTNHVQESITVPAGGSTTVYCNLAAATPPEAPALGSHVTGSLQMTNGASIPFSSNQQ